MGLGLSKVRGNESPYAVEIPSLDCSVCSVALNQDMSLMSVSGIGEGLEGEWSVRCVAIVIVRAPTTAAYFGKYNQHTTNTVFIQLT